MKKVFLLLFVLLGLLVTVSSCAPATPKVTLPEGAQQLTPFIPGMGEHWAIPSQLPLGPVYLLHDGEVIGVEYMFTTNLMQEITVNTPEGELTFRQLPGLPVDAYVNHMGIEFLPEGHDAFKEPHFDVHLYFISPGERQVELVPHEH